MKNILALSLLIVITVMSITAIAQTGPGGVGNATGANSQPHNVMWFAADSLNLNNGDLVSIWNDISGNGNDAEQSVSASRPIFTTGEINGLPAVVFDGSDDFMPFDGNQIANSDYTVIFVGKRRTNNSFRVFMGGTTSSSNRNLHLYWANSSQFRAHHYGNDLQTNMLSNALSYSGGTDPDEYGAFATLLASSESSDQRRNYQNNSYLGSRSNATQLSDYNGSAIGRYTSGYHNVNASEVIFYSTALNDAQLQIVYQYLEIKYGINIDNDLYSPNASYTYGVAGVGEEANGEHTIASSAGLYLETLAGTGAGDYIFTSHNNATNNAATISTADLGASGAVERYNRIWYLEEVNTPEVRLSFDFQEALEDADYPSNASNYTLLYRAGTSGNFSKVQNADGIQTGDQVYFDLTSAELQSGYYTFGTENSTDSPLEGVTGLKWYTLITGDWDNWETWTLDPSGALPDNPNNLTPTSSPTSEIDEVVILSGRSITIQPGNDNKTNVKITVDGELNLTTTSGHEFAEIRGSGRIIANADNFPDGDATHFITEGLGEGTVVFEGAGYNLSNLSSYEFFNMQISLDNSADEIVLTKDLQINGDLTIDTGALVINNDVLTDIVNIHVEGDVNVSDAASILTGEGDVRTGYQIGGTMPIDDGKEYHSIFHQFVVQGNFYNYGTVRFTNQNAPDYDDFPTNGAVTLRFEGSSNTNMQCYGVTDVYNLVIDKGVDKTYQLNLFSDDITHFNLFGANSVGRVDNSLGYSSEAPLIRKALFIKNGTLKLTGNISIPSLSEGNEEGGNGDYAIGMNSSMWMAGVDVNVYSTASDVDQITGFTSGDTYTASGVRTSSSNQAMSVFGEFRISDGTFGTRNSAGFIFWAAANAQVKIEGGTSNVSQLRAAGSGGVCSFTQTDGTLIIRGNETEAGEVSGDPIFEIQDPTGTFNMSGGEIVFYDIAGSSTNGMFVPSTDGNFNVTGGKITIEVRSGNNFEIGIVPPIWDLEIARLSGTGTTIVRLTNDLKVLNDLTINDNCLLDVRDDADGSIYDLYVGGNWDHQDGADYNARTNTTHFYSNQNTNIRVRDVATAGALVFNDVVIYKDQRYNTSLFRSVEVNGYNRPDGNHPLLINGDLTITRGEFDLDEFEVHLKGNVEITDGQIIATSGSDPEGTLILNGSALQTIKGSNTLAQPFGNIEVDNTNGVQLLSNIDISDLTISQGILDIQTFNLDATGDISISSPGTSQMIQMSGNASDGGLTRYIDGDATYVFPIGTNANALTRYTPASVVISSFTDDGKLTINIADEILATTASGGGDILSYYWRVDHEEFGTLPQAAYTLSYDESDVDGSLNEGSFVPGYVLDANPFTRNIGNFLGVDDAANTIDFDAANLDQASYTAGMTARFLGSAQVFYLRRNGAWNNGNNWSFTRGGGAAGDYPQAGDIAVIRRFSASYSGIVDVTSAQNAALVIFDDENGFSSGCPRIVFHTNGGYAAYNSNFNRVEVAESHEGGVLNGSSHGAVIQYDVTSSYTGNFPNGDFGDFNDYENALVIYKHDGGGGPVTLSDQAIEYPQMWFAGNNRDFIFPEVDVLIKGMTIVPYGISLYVNDGNDGDLIFEKNLRLGHSFGAGSLIFPGSSTSNRTVTIKGDLVMQETASALEIDNPTGGGMVHSLNIEGNITLSNGDINLGDGDPANTQVELNLTGEDNGEFTNTGSGTVDLYRIILNKSGAGTPSFDFSDDFTLNGPTDGDDKALELISGRLQLTDSDIDITLTSGGADFKIPAEAELYLGTSATVRVSGNNTGIWLDGKISAGWNTNFLLNEGDNNYIEYTASGNSEIVINQANAFYVGSQIRRSTDTEEGILKFYVNNDNNDIRIGTDNSIPENNRGVFEILNAGSELTMVDYAVIKIANAQDNPTFPAIYLNPDSYTLGTGSAIQVGTTETNGSQIIGIYSNIPLKNIELNNDAGSDPELKIERQTLEIEEDITIAANTTLNADGWDINLAGDFTNNGGTYNAGENTIIFDGDALQSITGTSTFYNLTRTGGSELQTFDDLIVENIFDMASGTFTDNDNTLTIKGNINFGGTHDWGGSSNGIYLNGEDEQIMTGAGTYDRLTINNSGGVSIDPNTGSGITITNELQLNEGIFDIDQYLLYLQSAAEITTSTTFDANTLIQTNISFTDAGILKDFPAIASTTVYEIPVGVAGKYTPIGLSIDAVDAGGSIRFKAANEMQPTITDDSDEACLFNDLENVLQYHWILEATNITNFTADMTMEFDPSDALAINGCGYDTSYYIAARILTYGDGSWNKYDYSNFNGAAHQLEFSFSGTDDDGISGDYTAGIEQPGINANGAIPNEVTEFITLTASSSWDDPNDWAVYDSDLGTKGAPGVGVPASGPRGAIIYVDNGHTLSIPSNYISAYKTIIQTDGTLDIGTTFGHRLGIVTGTGTLYVERGELPAGIYDEFFSNNGGTLEYGGSNSYTVMGGLTQVNNVTFSGSNVKWFPNNNVTINGNLEVNGAVIAGYVDKTFSIHGNFTRTSGYCRLGYSGSSKSTVKFVGSADQTISGDIYAALSSVKNIEVDKPSGDLNITGKLLLNGDLTLTQGNVVTTGQNLYLSSASEVTGGSTASYVNGPMYKTQNSSEDFLFPIGKDDSYRPIGLINPTDDAFWMAEYFTTNAADSDSDLGPGLATISGNDSWILSDVNNKHPKAKIKLYWGTETNVSADPSDHDDLRVVYKDGTGKWQTMGNASYAGDVNSGWLVSTDQASFSTVEFTIASATPANPLPVTLLGFSAEVKNDNQVALKWQTSAEINNDYFVVERSRDGVIFDDVTTVNGNGTTTEISNYQTTDYEPYTGISYYRLKQVDFDGKEEIFPMVVVEIEGLPFEEPRLNIHPNPYKSGDVVVDIGGFNEQEEVLVMISDISGNPICQKRMYPNATDMSRGITEKLQHAEPGFYLFIIVSNDKRVTARIIKE
jgi:hypothetical protein